MVLPRTVYGLGNSCSNFGFSWLIFLKFHIFLTHEWTMYINSQMQYTGLKILYSTTPNPFVILYSTTPGPLVNMSTLIGSIARKSDLWDLQYAT